jgi:hypothetical protein
MIKSSKKDTTSKKLNKLIFVKHKYYLIQKIGKMMFLFPCTNSGVIIESLRMRINETRYKELMVKAITLPHFDVVYKVNINKKSKAQVLLYEQCEEINSFMQELEVLRSQRHLKSNIKRMGVVERTIINRINIVFICTNDDLKMIDIVQVLVNKFNFSKNLLSKLDDILINHIKNHINIESGLVIDNPDGPLSTGVSLGLGFYYDKFSGYKDDSMKTLILRLEGVLAKKRNVVKSKKVSRK